MKLLSNSLLRSVIRFGQEDEKDLSSNLFHLRAEVEPGEIDRHLLDFIGSIYDRTHIVPNVQLLVKQFEDLENAGDGRGTAGKIRLAQLFGEDRNPLTFLTGPEFRYALDSHKRELMQEVTSGMLLEASAIITTGLKGRDGQMRQGPEAAIEHITGMLAMLGSSLKRGSIEGSFRRDAQLMLRAYERWKNSPETTVGVLTGIDKFDIAHRGVRPGQLCLVMGFVGNLKTTFCLNWLYRASVQFNRNTAIASLEMPVEDLRTSLYVMHSGHQQFADAGYRPLDYDKVTTASLSAEEEAFFRLVIDDFENNPNYGEIYYKEPEGSITVAEIRRWAETKHQVTPLDMLVVDYLGLVDPGKGVSGLESVSSLNKVIRQSKIELAMAFDSGRGIGVVSPFQANREGYKDAEKNGGRYKITALAGSNEAERSSDLIYYTYLDDTLRNSRELLVGNLKARKSVQIAEPFKVFADPSTMMIGNLDTAGGPADLVTI